MSEITEIIEKGAIEYIRKSFSICYESPTNKKSIKKRKSKICYILIFLTILFIAIVYVFNKIVWLFKELREGLKDLCEGLSYIIKPICLICVTILVVMAAKYSHKIEIIRELMKAWTS